MVSRRLLLTSREKKNQIFSYDCAKFLIVPVCESFSKQKSQLAENDFVGMFAENLVEVGFVWCVGPEFFSFHI
jgi:hypothetical protein